MTVRHPPIVRNGHSDGRSSAAVFMKGNQGLDDLMDDCSSPFGKIFSCDSPIRCAEAISPRMDSFDLAKQTATQSHPRTEMDGQEVTTYVLRFHRLIRSI